MRPTVWNNKIHVLGLVLLLVASLANAADPARMETLTVGGTGSAMPLIGQFAQAYGSLEPNVKVRVVDPPLGSNGAIRAVLAGAVDLAVLGKPLTEAEKAQGCQDWELGRTPFLVVTERKLPLPGFTVEQLAAIYSGKMTTWSDGSPIRLVVRNLFESDTLILRKMSPDMDRAVDVALARPGMLVAANDLENIDLLERTPDSLGTSNLALVQAQNRKLNALPINGKEPTLAAMRQGTYPYSKSIYLARGPKLSPVAQGFLEFILSASGKEILDRAGYVPAPSQP
ncbi:PstS family phosphate ABC transporter substrate-binding protein [Candidatus Competibacter phosphatis]|nr:substrate-binding domain-containing protein [Candidatus Competibacter phosphatis]